MPYGYHLVLDLTNCSRDTCNDMELVYDFLCESVDLLGMTTQSAPHVVRTDHELYPEQEGLSAWVPLVESSIVVHTVAPKNFISVDVYTCSLFEVDELVAFSLERFGGNVAQRELLTRGSSIK